MALIDDVKTLLGISDSSKDALISLLVSQCSEEAKIYTRSDNANDLGGAIAQMVVYRYGRLGTEGVDSEGLSGASFSYSADYPEGILRQLRTKRRVILK